ncbi:MAG: DUF72 domain-containing protein [Gemmatimonadales bacterium]
MRVHVGTSGYNFPEWKGSFYPDKLPAAKMLAYYAERLPTVEINYTFYRMPTVKTIAGWAEATPEHFTFVLKAPQRITHIARLHGAEDALRYFCDTVLGLGARLGPVLFQLPPTFRQDLERLRAFLPQISQEIRCAFEFRHASWFVPETYDLLRGRNVALCVADTDAGTTPPEATADFGYFRLRDEGYAPDDLAEWARRIQDLGTGWKDAFVFFKHEESGLGPKLAHEFRGLL